eukprot:403371825
MNNIRLTGYDSDSIGIFNIPKEFTRFLQCQICFKVARDAKECDYCNQLFCKRCIENWLILNKNCPMCHRDIRIRGASRVVKEIIQSFRMKCQYCQKVYRLAEIEQHEQQCGQITCDNPLCQKQLENQKYYEVVTSEGKLCVCNEICENLAKFKRIKNKKGDIDCLKFYQSNLSSAQALMGDSSQGVSSSDQLEIANDMRVLKRIECLSPDFIQKMQMKSLTHFRWDPLLTSDSIELTADNRTAYLQEDTYLFRSIIADTKFDGGLHYWELVADSRTDNELKIGVSKSRDIDLKTSFSDYSTGWAFYGIGQLRHCDSANGPNYGKSFKRTGTLGILLDMNKGALSFSLDGEYLGVAFEDEELKKGPIYPAIALLHIAGCTLVTGKPAPAIFFT